MKNKTTFAIIVALLMLVVAVVGSTYAYYSLVASGNNATVNAKAEKYEIVYTGGTHINSQTCTMNVVSSKDDGCHTDVQIGVAQNVDVTVRANLFINVDTISNELKVPGFKWEVYRVNGNQETLVSNGNFSSIPVNNQIAIVTNQVLSTSLITYRVYFWIDGNVTDDSVYGTSFDGYIGASTEVLTGIVNNS